MGEYVIHDRVFCTTIKFEKKNVKKETFIYREEYTWEEDKEFWNVESN